MKKTKEVEIRDGWTVTFTELTARQIRGFYERLENGEEEDDLDVLRSLISEGTDIEDIDTLEDLAPSEMKELWTAFKEVNADFFGVIEGLGILENVKGELKRAIQSELTRIFAAFSNGDTGSPGSTDGDSSGDASESPTD